MSLINVSEILKPCINKNWAVGGYDIIDMSVCRGVIDAAKEDNAPVIFMIYPAMVPVSDYIHYANFLKKEIERAGITAAITLDHGSSIEQVEAALAAGFTGVMIDASKEPLEKNISITKQAVKLAHQVGASVEAELGHVGKGTDILTSEKFEALLTPVEDAKRFVGETDVDLLAVAIGTAHGLYKFKPQLDFTRLARLRAELNIPLVLHGSSGTPNDQLEKVIELGIDKLNVYTDIRVQVLNALHNKVVSEPIENYDLPDVLNIMRLETKNKVHERNTFFKSVGKASLYND